MSARTELIKLEAMYYHQREAKHIHFLENNEVYAWFRTIGTFKAGPKEHVLLSRQIALDKR
jgi:hypothetical protein